LQGDFLANWKGKNRYIMLVHCFIYSGIIYAFLMCLGVASIWCFVILMCSHDIIDTWKCGEVKVLDLEKDITTITKLLYIDQIAHYFILICIFIGVVL
ncbi:unnamed protein product, partial [marine sediment metagenome]